MAVKDQTVAHRGQNGFFEINRVADQRENGSHWQTRPFVTLRRMPVPWTPDEATFLRRFERRWVSVVVDLGALQARIDQPHPTLILLEFALRNPRADGLVSPEEHAPRADLEDALTATMAEAVDGWPVGRFVHAGKVTLAFYGLPEPLRPSDPTHGWEPYTVRSEIREDPGWSYLREDLAPDAAERRQIASLRQVAALKGLGDLTDVDRTVDWTLAMPDDAAAARAAGDLREAGYRISHLSAHLVTATRSHSLNLLTLVDRQEEVASIAERHGGEFGGWGSPIVASPLPNRRRWRPRRGA
jgi:hypothetical protein